MGLEALVVQKFMMPYLDAFFNSNVNLAKDGEYHCGIKSNATAEPNVVWIFLYSSFGNIPYLVPTANFC